MDMYTKYSNIYVTDFFLLLSFCLAALNTMFFVKDPFKWHHDIKWHITDILKPREQNVSDTVISVLV